MGIFTPSKGRDPAFDLWIIRLENERKNENSLFAP